MKIEIMDAIPHVISNKISRFEFIKILDISAGEFGFLNPHLEEFDVFEPGVPLNIPEMSSDQLTYTRERDFSAKGSSKPLDWAIEEFEKGVREYAGPCARNPEIEKYLFATGGVAPDDIPWCSSFVNWCAEMSGLEGTENKAARSWHQWGTNTKDPARGDIVVFRRRDSSWKGHVGFFWDDAGAHVNVLGGNQSNAVSISAFPKNGSVYNLLSFRKVG